MAEYSDGSMIVDTEIDTEGFLKDSEKLRKAVASLCKQVDTIGQQMKTAIAKNNTAAFETLKQKLTESQGQADALRNKLEGFSRVRILSDDYIKITAEIKKADDAMKRLSERQEKLKALGADQSSEKWQKLQSDIEKVNAKLDESETKMEQARVALREMQSPESYAQLRTAEDVAAHGEAVERQRAEYNRLKETVSQLSNEIGRLYDQEEKMKASGADVGSKQYQSLLYDMEKLREKQEQLNAEREKMESEGTAFNMGNTTQEYEQLNQQMDQVEQHMEQVEQEKDRAFTAPSASGLAGFLARVAKSALHASINLAKMVGNGALSYLRKLASGAKNAAIQLMKLAGRAIASGIQNIGTMAAKAGKSLFSMGKNAKQSRGGLNVGLKAILRYGLGIRSVFALLNKFRNAVKEAFENMAKKVPEVNTTLSKLSSSLDRVKNSLATAFQPILTAVTPYLVQFMDMISNALTKVGEFFAALTGQKYVYKATKAQIDYAKSLDKTKKAAKEAENQLAGFDDLDILKDNSKEDKEETPTSDFEKIPIESQISDFAKRIKDAFNSGDFYEIGKILAEKVYGWFSSIDWVKVGTIIGKGIMALVDIILGFAENFPWAEVGRRLAMGLNALFDNIDPVRIAKALIAVMNGALDALLAFIETFKWEKHGKKLAAGIRQFIKDLPVEKLGEVLRKGIVGILKFIRPALGDKETWSLAGQKLGDLLNELFKGKPGKDNIWTELEGAIVDLAEGVVTALSNFVATFKWGDNGKVFHDAVFRLVDDFPLNELGGALMDLLKGSLEFMNETFGDQTLFANLGKKLADFMNTVFSKKETWEEIGKTANNMLKDVLTFTHGFLEDFEPETAADSIKAALGEIDWDDIASKTWDTIKLAFSKAGSFLDALMNEDVDSASSMDEAYERLMFNKQSFGTKLGAKLAEAIRNVPWEEVGSALSKLAQRIFDTITDFFTELTKAGQNGKSPIEDAVDNFMKGVDWDALKESFVRAAEATFKAIGQSLGRIILNGIFGVLSDEEMEEGHQKVLDQAEERADKTGVSLSSAYLQVGESVADSYYAGMKDRAENTDDVAPVFESALDVILNAADPEAKGKGEAEQFYSGFKNTVLDDQGEVKSQFESVLNEIFLPSELEALKNGELSADDFAQAFEEGTRTVGGDATQALTDFFNLVFNSQDMETPGKGLATDAVDGFTGELEGKESQVADAMKKALYDPFDEKVRGKEGFDAHSPSRTTEGLGKDVVEGFAVGLEGQKDDADKRSKTLFEGLFKTIVATADAMHTFQTIILTALTNLEKHFPTRMNTYKTQFETGWKNINSVVATSMTTLQGTILTGLTNLEKVIPPRFEAIGRSIENQNWWRVGNNIVSGIQRGIQDSWPWLENTVRNLAQSLYNAACNALGIHSPSTLFENGVGKMLGLGTAIGYEKSQPKILEAVSDVADAMAAEMNKADITANLGVKQGGITDDLDDVLSTFSDRVSDSFASLMNRLEAIANSVTFRLPEVATGGVLPYSVTGDVDGPSNSISQAMKEYTDEQISALIQMFNNQTVAVVRAIEEYAGTDVQIGDDVIGKAAVRYINRMKRTTGKTPIII